MLALQNFQQRLYRRYKSGLALPPTYCYLHGNAVQPVAPVYTAYRSVCIITAFPPARLAAVGAEQDVPVADDCGHLLFEPYFDGSRVRSAAGLAETCLASLGLRRELCWLTCLVRVFLFSDEHLARYRRLDCDWPEWETRSRFNHLARQGLGWLEEELALARPRLVITLGAEVAGVLQDAPDPAAAEALLGGDLKDLWLGETVYPALHLAGPESRPAWKEHLPAARGVVERVVG